MPNKHIKISLYLSNKFLVVVVTEAKEGAEQSAANAGSPKRTTEEHQGSRVEKEQREKNGAKRKEKVRKPGKKTDGNNGRPEDLKT